MDGHGRVRVVVVDDHAPMRQLLAMLLSGRNSEVVGEARDGREALDVVAAAPCDIVVMDLNMPVMDGVEATAEIRRRHPDVTVLAFTSSDDRALVRRALEAGAAEYFDKLDVNALVRYVQAQEPRRDAS